MWTNASIYRQMARKVGGRLGGYMAVGRLLGNWASRPKRHTAHAMSLKAQRGYLGSLWGYHGATMRLPYSNLKLTLLRATLSYLTQSYLELPHPELP